MLLHRCPWCGEEFTTKNTIIDLSIRNRNVCPYCNGKIIKAINKKKIIIFLVVFLLTMPFLRSRATHAIRGFDLVTANIFLIIMSILLVIFILLLFRAPWKRDNDSNSESKTVSIDWIKGKNGGFWFPALSIYTKEILTAFFISKDGTVISHGLCVVLNDIRWTTKFQCTCEISMVLDNIQLDQFFIPESSFYLFYKKKKVAEGRILNKKEDRTSTE